AGPIATSLRLRTESRLDVLPQTDSGLTTVKRALGVFDLHIAPNLDHLPIVFSDPKANGRGDKIACTIPLRRVRWSITGIPTIDPSQTDHRLVFSRDELEQAPAPMLLVSIPGGDEHVLIDVRLLDSGDREHFVFATRTAAKAR